MDYKSSPEACAANQIPSGHGLFLYLEISAQELQEGLTMFQKLEVASQYLYEKFCVMFWFGFQKLLKLC